MIQGAQLQDRLQQGGLALRQVVSGPAAACSSLRRADKILATVTNSDRTRALATTGTVHAKGMEALALFLHPCLFMPPLTHKPADPLPPKQVLQRQRQAARSQACSGFRDEGLGSRV